VKEWQSEYKKKVIDPSDVQEAAESIRASGKTIATLNGSFDLLHSGHLQSIYEASQLADILIVALNSDSSIKRYKDPSRPIITLEHRLQMIAALDWVDFATWFDETDPRRLLEKIKPDVHVNGIEWKNNCVEEALVASYGGKMHYVPLISGLSTTQIVNNIANLYDQAKVN
jgi:D-glycero-beta-D-manno-heptose 1-phosphate adenylyltransferase